MTYEYSSTDAGIAHSSDESNSESGVADELVLYGEPHHKDSDDYDEQTLYGDPQHESSDETGDAWDVELLFADTQLSPIESDGLEVRTNSSAVERTER